MRISIALFAIIRYLIGYQNAGFTAFSTLSVVQGWMLAAMLFSLPFCLIWVYCGWLRTEPQLKYINIVFTILYIYGIARYFILDL